MYGKQMQIQDHNFVLLFNNTAHQCKVHASQFSCCGAKPQKITFSEL